MVVMVRIVIGSIRAYLMRTPMTLHTIDYFRSHSSKLVASTAALCLGFALISPAPVLADDHKIRHVLVISVDGMHALDLALWVKANPNSALGKLAAQGMN